MTRPAEVIAEAMREIGARGYPAKRLRLEDRLQIEVVEMLRLLLDPRHYRVIAIRNEGRRSAVEGALAKRMGLDPGAPDLEIIGPGGIVWRIELKTAAGKTSPEQDQWHAWLAANGCPHAVCRSLDDVHAAIKAWRIPTREGDR